MFDMFHLTSNGTFVSHSLNPYSKTRKVYMRKKKMRLSLLVVRRSLVNMTKKKSCFIGN